MKTFRTIYRGVDGGPGWKDLRAGGAKNTVGCFVQNAHGATVAGPFESMHAAWAEEDRLTREANAPEVMS